MAKQINDFLTVPALRELASFSPRNRDEYRHFNQIAYNLKLNTSVPTTVHIEPTNKCNQTCKMCVHPDMKRDEAFIDDAIAMKAIDECAKFGVYAVHFFFFGEPFLNRRTVEYIKYAKQVGIPLVSTTTNFTSIKEKEIERLVVDGLDSIHISFEGIDRDRYKQIRGTNSYDKVLRNLAKLEQYKRQHAAKNPWVAMTYVRTTETDAEIEGFLRTWSDKVDDIHVSPQFDYIGRAPIRREQEGVNSGAIMDRSRENRLPCRQLWLRLVVLANGELVPCSQNIDGELSVGNIRNMTIAEAWQNDAMRRLRADHVAGRIEPSCVCSNCIDWDWSGKVDDRPTLARIDAQDVIAEGRDE